MLEEYLSDSVDVSQAEKDLAVMQTDGSWKDIDYKTVTFYFDAERHLKRLKNMALAYSKPGNKLFHEQELRKKIILGLDYFRIANPDSGNWWYRDIGAPSQYMIPLLLLKKELKREDVTRLSSYLADKTDNVAHKGKNRTWVSAVLIHKGCIEDNYELIAKGFSSIASTIYVEEKDDEGMKRDNSIHQHRPQLYSGAENYEAWKRHISGEAFPVLGNTHFWKSNIMTHHGSDYYMSAKVISVRTNGTEMLNGQNLKGYYLPLGATNIMTTGHEYDDVFVVWDWTRVPGTTAVANQSTADLRWYLFGSNQFGGGVSNAHNGVMAYEHAYQGVEARKAYFFMGDAMVCMGSGIKAARTQEVRTSVNQCLANGEVTYGLSGHAYQLTDNLSDKKIDWAYHDNVGYIFPQNGSVTLRKAKQTGSWRELEVTASEKPVTKEVFSLWISHGTTPQNEDYCYIIMPDKPLSYFTDKKFENEIKIIANTERLQAITNENKRQYAVVFYEPGEIRFSDDLVVAVNKKVLLYIEKKDGQYEIAVADPLYKEKSVQLSLNGEQMDITFPSGDYSGSSVIKHIAQKH